MRDWYMVETFPLETERSLGGKIYFSDKPESNKVLIFGYGLGKNFSQNIEGFRLFANALRCWHGITVVTFDYRGTCASKMKFEKSSLLTRFEDFCSVVEYVRVLFPLKNWQIFLGGHSAGGPLAIRVADHFRDISGIILTAPAAYHNDAWKMRFGKAFTKVLARKHGWRYSLEFETLEELHKPTGLVVCEGDRVVWKAITKKYSCAGKEHITRGVLSVGQKGHQVFAYPVRAQVLAGMVGRFLNFRTFEIFEGRQGRKSTWQIKERKSG